MFERTFNLVAGDTVHLTCSDDILVQTGLNPGDYPRSPFGAERVIHKYTAKKTCTVTVTMVVNE